MERRWKVFFVVSVGVFLSSLDLFIVNIAFPEIRRDFEGASLAGMKAFRDAGPDARLGVCLEVLHRLHGRIFELANAVQHTSGQAFVMAFQAGGAHALDRALDRADRVMLVQDGTVTAAGTHRELLRTDPVYRSVVTRETDEELTEGNSVA